MIDILNLKPHKVTKDLKDKYILIYSKPKAGKTSFAASVPKSLLLAFEKGYNGIEGVRAVDVNKWSDFNTYLRQLKTSEAREMYDVVIIDTVDLMWSAAEKYVLAQNVTKTGETPKALGDVPWGAGFTQCKKIFDEALREIAMLGYGVILISHSKITPKKDRNSGEEYEYISCSLPDMAKLIANRFVDLICFLECDRDKRRWLYTRDRGDLNIEVGSRFQYLEDKIPLSYDSLTSALEKAIELEANNKGRKEVSNVSENIIEKEKTYEELIDEARNIFNKVVAEDVNRVNEFNNVITKHFGKPIKLSESTPEQKELVEMVVNDWKAMI